MSVLIFLFFISTAQAKDLPTEQSKEWASQVASALCLRTVACSDMNQNLSVEGCISGLQGLLAEAFAEKGGKFNQEKITACVDAIGKESCEALNSSVPGDCKFLKGIIDAKTGK